MGKVFDGAGYEKYGGLPGRNYLLSFRVIAMGDLNAVDLAQQVHLEILQDSGCMNPGDCIEFKHPLPASHTMEGLYIDDHIITQILPDKHHREKRGKNLGRSVYLRGVGTNTLTRVFPPHNPRNSTKRISL